MTTPIFVLDANFFICIKDANAERPYYYLALAKEKLGIDLYVSAQVFNECPFITGRNFQEFNKGVKVELVTDLELERIKNDLAVKGVQLMAQDPDLTLIALAKRLKTNQNEVCIVSDDFKLSQNVDTLQYRIKFWSLPAFLQFITKNITGKEKDYFRILRKRVLKLNLDYMLSRDTVYPAQAKIAWLLENAVSVADEGIKLKKETLEELHKQERMDDFNQLFSLSSDYIEGKPIPKDQWGKIAQFESGLGQIQTARQTIKLAKEAFMADDETECLNNLRKAQDALTQTFQYIAAKYSKHDFRFLELILASEISKVAFIRSFVLLGKSKFVLAYDSLMQTALFATVARLSDTVLTINFLIALIHVFESRYNRAITQFQFLRQLAESYGDNILVLKAVIGEAVTQFALGQRDNAISLVKTYRETHVKMDIQLLATALLDSGDYFMAMGFPEIASNLYSKALECTIDIGKDIRIPRILNKMKKSYMASALIGTTARPSAEISVLINTFYDLKNVDNFNDQMTKLAQFTNKLYEPFGLLATKRKKYSIYDLPKDMTEEFECIKIQENPDSERTLLIAFREDIGLIAFDVLLDKPLEGVPENYVLQLRNTAQITLKSPDVIKESLFLIRAIVVIEELDRDLKIIRNIPAFFGQMKV